MTEKPEGRAGEAEAIDLAGYKESIPLINKASLTLDRDLIFNGRTRRGYELDFDPEMQWGCSPTESLLLSIAGCLAIDVVSFLRKMKAEVSGFRIDMEGKRRPNPPQYYTEVEMTIEISGRGITPKRMDRVISLSQEKYCSVYHSLRKDIKVVVKYDIKEQA